MIMTYDRRRIVSRAGRVGRDAMRSIDEALAMHLGLETTVRRT
jgi:mRNA-degrading endonuclease toxin of MazEF toxin-antitoxin module